jgi:hypothetical protein
MATTTRSLLGCSTSRCAAVGARPCLIRPAARTPAVAPILRSLSWSSGQPVQRTSTQCRVQAPEQSEASAAAPALVGEDAAAFSFEKQSLQSWGLFFVLLTTVLGALYAVSTGMQAGSIVLHALSSTPATHASAAAVLGICHVRVSNCAMIGTGTSTSTMHAS